jgi:hypothetical protein
MFFIFLLFFCDLINSSVVQAVLVHRSLRVLHVLLEHICGDEKRFEARYLLSLSGISSLTFSNISLL